MKNVGMRTGKFRRGLATFLVALYAFCVLAPHAALAFVHAQNAIHCFTETGTSPHQHEHAATSAHVHEDGTAHDHHPGDTKSGAADEDKSAQTACCGLFSVSAIAAEAPAALLAPAAGDMIAVLPQSDLADHPPGRLIRPPII